MNILISKDRNFLYFDGKVANIATNNSVDLSLISITEIIDIFKSQSTSLLRENNNTLIEINSIIRSIGHLINEDLNFKDKQFFLFELENKLSNNLLVESIDNTILITEQAWNWVKDKAGKVWDTTKSGVKWVGDKLSDVGKYLWTQGLPWFFDRLKYDDGDYLLYASNDSLMIRRVWLKTALKDLRDKKIIFSDIEYHTNYVEIYFKEAK